MKYDTEVTHIFEVLTQKSHIEKILIRDHPHIHDDIISEWNKAHPFSFKTFSEALRYYMTGERFVCQYGNRKSMRSINAPLMCNAMCECVKDKRKKTNIVRHGIENPSQLESCKEKTKQTNMEKYGVEHVSQMDSIKEKMKQTNMEKYGVEYVSQLEDTKKKVKRTNMERHGVEHVSQMKSIKEKMKRTNMDKYGVECIFQFEAVKEKIKQTNIERYGVDCAARSKEIKEKIKQTNLERYGVEYTSQLEETKEKVKRTSVERYGVDCVLQSPVIREQIKNTNLEKYGVEYPSQLQIVKDKVRRTFELKYGGKRPHSLVNEVFDALTNVENMQNLYDDGGVKTICEKYNIAESTANKFLRLCGIHRNGSSFEKEITSYLNELNVEYILHDRTILGGFEIDIFIPSHNVGIECDGVYWHTETNGKHKNYHVEKTRMCSEKGIRLLHILDVNWMDSTDIYKSLIATVLKKNTRKIPARKCVVKKISSVQSKEFLNENHRQGDCVAKYRYGLFFDDELVQVMTFGTSRFSTKYQYELLRLCTINYAIVVGGASKLFKAFLDECSPDSIGTYCDISLNSGTVYETLSFNFVGNTPPSFCYVDRYCNLYSRIQFQKHKLKDRLSVYDENKTALANMQMNGFDRIWDCGNSSWIWKKNSKGNILGAF